MNDVDFFFAMQIGDAWTILIRFACVRRVNIYEIG